MVLDAATVRNLELVEPLFAGESRDATLIHVLDKTCYRHGWPLASPPLAESRHASRKRLKRGWTLSANWPER